MTLVTRENATPVGTPALTRAFMDRAKPLELHVDCPPDGAFYSDTAIVAEYIGEQERRMKVPLVGGSGRMLWTELDKYADIKRQDVYVTNVIKRQIAGAHDDERMKIAKLELEHWQAMLRWELAQLPNLKYVLCLGNHALQALVGETGITNWRGSVVPIDIRTGDMKLPEMGAEAAMPVIMHRNLTAVIANNPAYILREPLLAPVFRMDLNKLKRVRNGTFKEHDIVAHINPEPDQALEWCDAMLETTDPVAFDIEVVSGETACVGFASSPYEGYCINFRDRESNRWGLGAELQVRQAIARVLREHPKLVAQNGSFDSYWLWYKDHIRVAPVWFDTMLAHHCLYPQLPHSLAFLTSQYTDHPFYKDEGKDWREGGDIDSFWRYNVRDVCITRAAQSRLMDELQAQKMGGFFFDHVMRLQSHLVRMTVGGVLIDAERKAQITEDLQEQVAVLRREFDDAVRQATGERDIEVNPRSPKQLSSLLFGKLGLVGRGTSTNALNRQRMLMHPRTGAASKRVLHSIDSLAKEQKFLSTYAEMKLDPDDRLRCEYKQTGVQSAPGRLSSAKVMWGSGMNMQNQPARAYDMFVADEGFTFVYFDLSQAEARVVGWLARIDSWIEQFEKARLEGGYDCHRALASEMFRVEYDDVPKQDFDDDGNRTIRYVAKRCRHGLNYRMAADKLAEVTGLSLPEAERAFRMYHAITPELRKWWAEEEHTARTERMLFSPLGRRLYIMSRIDDEALKSIIAFKPQSTVGDHVSRVIYLSESDEDWPIDARIVMNIHDALIAECRIEDATRVARIMKKHAETPIMIHGVPLVIPAEFKESQPGADGVRRWSTLEPMEIEA